MASAAEQKLSVVIAAIDETAAPIAAIAKQFSALAKQVSALDAPQSAAQKAGLIGGLSARIKSATQAGKDLIKSSGIQEFVGTLGKVKGAAMEAAEGVASIVTPLAGLSVLATIGGIGDLLGHWGQDATSIGRLAAQLAVTTTQFQSLAGAATNAGVPVSAVESSLSGLMQTMRQATFDASKIQLFERFGITLRNADGTFRTTANVLEQVADVVSRIRDPGAQADFLGKLGISPAMLPLLRNGSAALREMEARAQHFGLIQSPAQLAAGEAFGQSIRDARSAVEGLGNTIAASLAPVLTPIISAMSDWIAANRELIAEDVTSAVQSVADALKSVNWKRVGADIEWLYNKIGGLKGVLIGLAAISLEPVVASIYSVGAAIVSVGAVMLANPILLGITAIAAGALLIYENWDGIVGYFTGIWSDIKTAFDQSWGRGVLVTLADLEPIHLVVDLLNGISKAVFGFSLGDAARALMGTMVSGIESAWGTVKDKALGLAHLIPDAIHSAIAWVKTEVAAVMAVIQPAIDAATWLANHGATAAHAVGNALTQPQTLPDGSTIMMNPDGSPTIIPPAANSNVPPPANNNVPPAAVPLAVGEDHRSFWQRNAPEFLGGVSVAASMPASASAPASVTLKSPKVELQPMGGGNSPVPTPITGGGAPSVATPYSAGGPLMLGGALGNRSDQDTRTHVTIDFLNMPLGVQTDTRSSGPGNTQTNIQYAL